MGWQTVAEGTSLNDLGEVVGDMELVKGTKIMVAMNTSTPWLFDAAGAELAFMPFIPDGVKLIDVYGEGNQGIVEMEADPIWLLVLLAFIKAHWLAIVIAGFAIWLLISFITIMVKVPAIAQIPVFLIIGAAAGILGLFLLNTKKGKHLTKT